MTTKDPKFNAMRSSGKSGLVQYQRATEIINEGLELAKGLNTMTLNGEMSASGTCAKVACALIELETRFNMAQAQAKRAKREAEVKVKELERTLQLCDVKLCEECGGEGSFTVHMRRYQCMGCSGTGRVEKD